MKELKERLEQLREKYNYVIEYSVVYNFSDEAYIVIFCNKEDLRDLIPDVSKLMTDKNISAVIEDLGDDYIKVMYVSASVLSEVVK